MGSPASISPLDLYAASAPRVCHRCSMYGGPPRSRRMIPSCRAATRPGAVAAWERDLSRQGLMVVYRVHGHEV